MASTWGLSWLNTWGASWNKEPSAETIGWDGDLISGEMKSIELSESTETISLYAKLSEIQLVGSLNR